MRKLILGAILALCGANAAHAKKVCEGIFPKNDLWIPADERLTSGISKATFNAVLSKVERVYASIVRDHGGELVFNRLWSNGTVNSDTDLQGNRWVINSYGGLARFQGMTADAYTTIACHEIGHHLGGAPRFDGSPWASVEGEADYFSTTKCFRTVFAGDDNQKIVAGMNIDPIAVQKCETAFPNNASEIALCERAAVASAALGHVSSQLDHTAEPHFNTPDPHKVRQVFEDHPQAQCRMDTYFAGATCSAPTNVDFGYPDYTIGACNGSALGARPRCWFTAY